MSEITPISPAGAASVPMEAVLRVLKDSMKIQEEALARLLASMGVGENLDVTA